MATSVSTLQQIYDIVKDEIESRDGDFSDFNDGSMLDIISGAFAVGSSEITELIISEFRKTFFDTSHGIEITKTTDDLQTLAVDRYGDSFKRPSDKKSTGKILLSRPSVDFGNVLVNAGTIFKTKKDSQGQEILFETVSDVTMTGLTLEVDAIAVIGGKAGNVDPLKIEIIDTPLLDASITVSNTAKFAGGADAQLDAEYRETIRNLIQALAGATKAAVKGAILAVSGVEIAALVEKERIVIDYDIGNSSILAGASYFRIPYPIAYIADSNGQSSQALIDSVKLALNPVRACGVRIEIVGAQAINLSWDASFNLNASGPNFAELQNNFSKITDTMSDFIMSIEIGKPFLLSDANAYILAIWGAAGTGDITSFNTNMPIANVSVQATEKLIPDVMSINGAVCA